MTFIWKFNSVFYCCLALLYSFSFCKANNLYVLMVFKIIYNIVYNFLSRIDLLLMNCWLSLVLPSAAGYNCLSLWTIILYLGCLLCVGK